MAHGSEEETASNDVATDRQPALEQLWEEALLSGVSRKELVEHVPALAAALHEYPLLFVKSSNWRSKLFLPLCALVSVGFFVGIVICFVFVAFLLGAEWPLNNLETAWESVSEKWLDWRGYDPFGERCLVRADDLSRRYLDIFRPVLECDFCKNVSRIQRMSGISSSEFEQRFAYSAVPVVVTDATVNWTASKMFSFEFFRDIYAEDSPALTGLQSNCQFFRYKSDFRTLDEVFRMSSDRAALRDGTKPWYVGWSNCDSVAANILRKYYSRPYFLPDTAESSRTDWIFMGSPGYGAHMHVDNVNNPSWQAQIRGRKTWAILPPLECRYSCASHYVTVGPGDVIVLDTNIWYHSTLIEPGDISITIGSEFD